MKKKYKKSILIGSLIRLVAVAVAVKIVFGNVKSTFNITKKATDQPYNVADIINKETGMLITPPGNWSRWRVENIDGVVRDTSLNLD